MATNEIISIIVMVAVVGIVLWDMHRNKENEPRE
jgi:hypothetical protein